jgi:hypothetical protein
VVSERSSQKDEVNWMDLREKLSSWPRIILMSGCESVISMTLLSLHDLQTTSESVILSCMRDLLERGVISVCVKERYSKFLDYIHIAQIHILSHKALVSQLQTTFSSG